MIDPIVIHARVVGTHEQSQWSDKRRRVTLMTEEGWQFMVASDKLLRGERVTVTIAPEKENYGSEVLRTIPVGDDI